MGDAVHAKGSSFSVALLLSGTLLSFSFRVFPTKVTAWSIPWFLNSWGVAIGTANRVTKRSAFRALCTVPFGSTGPLGSEKRHRRRWTASAFVSRDFCLGLARSPGRVFGVLRHEASRWTKSFCHFEKKTQANPEAVYQVTPKLVVDWFFGDLNPCFLCWLGLAATC